MTPSGWKTLPLGDICEVKIGGTPSRNIPEFWDPSGAGHPWVSISDLKSKWIDSTAETITDGGVTKSNVKLVPAGTTVMSFKLTIGRVARAACDLYTNEAIAAFYPKPGTVDSDFLYYALPWAARSVEADQAVKGATLNKQKLQALSLSHPSLPEQKKIAAILGSVDDAIQATQAVIDQTRKVKAGLLQQLLTRGIGHARFKQTVIGEIPEDWNVAQVEDLADFTGGRGFTPPEWSSEGLPIIRIQNLNGSMDFNYFAGQPEAKWTIEPGELLFAWAGVKGVSFGPCLWSGPKGVLNQHIFRVTPRSSVNKVWLFGVLQQVTNNIEARAHGFKASLLHVRKGDIVGQPVPVPPAAEQALIAERLAEANKLEETHQAHLEGMRCLKQGLMADLLSGRTRVGVSA